MKLLTQWHKRLLRYPHVSFWLHLLFLLLLPASVLYGVATWIRSCAYDRGWLASYRSRLPVISVGNLAAGGTGKTPTVDYIVKELIGQGWSPAIVSRGYRGTYRGDAEYVLKAGRLLMTAQEAGDEPYLLAQRNPLSTVMVARQRVKAIHILEGDQQVDVVILDDGFQHRSVNRDVDIVLLDARAPFGNGWPLPAGNLREWPDALRRADLLLVTRGKTEADLSWTGLPVFQSRHRLSQFGVSLDGEQVPLADLEKTKLSAFAGIASPHSFFSALEDQGLSLVHKIVYPDHVAYKRQHFVQLAKVSQQVDALLTTEKDAVKLERGLIPAVCYRVKMDLEIDKPDRFRSILADKLRS